MLATPLVLSVNFRNLSYMAGPSLSARIVSREVEEDAAVVEAAAVVVLEDAVVEDTNVSLLHQGLNFSLAIFLLTRTGLS